MIEKEYLTLWREWLLKNREDARRKGSVKAEHWNRALKQFLKRTHQETYISPFTGQEV